MTKAELLRERERCSKACMDLMAIAAHLIHKLRDTRYASADQEAKDAEAKIRKIRRGR